MAEAREVVANVDSYQDLEKECVILSCVCSSPNNQNTNIGFLRNPNRANAALTRARSALIIVGNPYTLYSDDYWRTLIDFFNAKNQIIPFHNA